MNLDNNPIAQKSNAFQDTLKSKEKIVLVRSMLRKMTMLMKTGYAYENARVQKSTLVDNTNLNNLQTKRKKKFSLFMRNMKSEN